MTTLTTGPIGTLAAARRFSSAIDRLIYLRGLSDLGNVDGGELAVIAQLASERFFPAGSHLLRQGERPDAMHFIVEGQVDVSRDGIVHQICESPHGVGFIPLLARNPDGVDAVAAVDTLTLEIPGSRMLELVEDNFNFLLAVLRGLSEQLGATQRDLELRGLLERSEPRAGPYPEERLDIVQRLTRLRRGPYVSVNLEPLIEMSRLTEEIRTGPGEVLWREGDAAEYGLTIIHGIVRCASSDGTRAFRMGNDSVLGYLDANARLPRAYDAVTETRLVALKGTTESYHDILEDHKEVGVAFVTFMANVITELRIKAARADQSATSSIDAKG